MEDSPTASGGCGLAATASRAACSTAVQSRSAGTSAASGAGWSRSYSARAGCATGSPVVWSSTAAFTDDVPTSIARMCMGDGAKRQSQTG